MWRIIQRYLIIGLYIYIYKMETRRQSDVEPVTLHTSFVVVDQVSTLWRVGTVEEKTFVTGFLLWFANATRFWF